MKTLKHLSRLTLLLLCIGLTSCSNDDNGPTPPMEEDANIVEAAQATSELSTLVAALQKADESANNDLITALSGEGPFTVFAPTNEAFNDLLAQLDGFDSLDDFSSQQLQDLLAVILTYHVVADAAFSTDLSDGMSLTTLQGSSLQVDIDGDVFIQDATDVPAQVVDADIEVSNGVVHIIDKVLLPQAILDELADIILVPITDLALGNENLENLNNLNEEGLDDLGKGQKQGQYGDRYYREFNFADISPDPNFSKKQNSERLITILDQILTNPYNVLIGELSLYPDPERFGNMRGEIPITYSVRSALTQELFTSLPHDKLMDAGGNVILQFPNSNFIFDELLLEKLALMKFQLMPVIFFNNRIGGIQFIILDSWNEKYQNLELQKISMLTENQFKPLFALTPGSDNIQLNLDVSSQEVGYNFSIPHEAIGDYTKVTVKFMPEVELDALLAGQGGTK